MCIYYTAYIITNLINGKKYAGIHKTRNLYDSYMGSGVCLKNALKKYGRENFRKDIVEIFSTEEEMYNWEINFVTQQLIEDINWYNIQLGGGGGFTSDMAKRGVETQKQKGTRNCNNPNTVAKQLASRKANGTMNSRTQEQIRAGVETRRMNGTLARSLETRQKLSEKRKGKSAWNKGVPKTLDERAKMSERFREYYKSHPHPSLGKKRNLTSEQRLQIGEKSRNRARVQCEHCGKTIDIAMYIRWHGDRCSRT